MGDLGFPALLEVGPPPPAVSEDLKALGTALDQVVPPKELDRNLLVATWNLRAFGGLTKKWQSAADDSPKRDLHDVFCIASVGSRFDVVALQEVRGDLRALRYLLKALGPDWAFLLTDVTKGKEGNDERMAFVYDTRRVKLSGLAAELVVWIESSPKIKEGALGRQFARTPYAVGFQSAGATFILVTLHVIYGKNPQERVGELKEIADWLADWTKEVNGFNQNLIALGDFNIDRAKDPLYEAFVSTGLRPPPEIEGLRRTIFDDPGKEHHFDQVAWFTGEDGSGPRLEPPLRYDRQAGNFDFVPVLLKSMSTVELSWRISDHYPLWVGFSVRPE